MELTDKQIYDLNNMNVPAQNIGLGTVISEVMNSKGGTRIMKPATKETLGGIKQMELQQDSMAEELQALKSDFNSLLAKLKKAGIMAGK